MEVEERTARLYTTAAGCVVEADVHGDGEEAVILLHSSGCGTWQWKEYQRVLGRDFLTAAVHLHGYGATSAWGSSEPQRLTDQSALIEAVVEAIGKPVHLVGHSFGGAVALEAARQCAGVRSVTVYEPSLFWPLRRASPASWAEIVGLMEAVRGSVAGGEPERAAEAFVDYWSQAPRWSQLHARQRSPIITAMAVHALEWDAAMTPPAAPEEWLDHVPAPTLVLVANNSPAPMRDIADILTSSGRREIRVTSTGGHLAPIDDPPAVLPVIRSFIDRHVEPKGDVR